MFLSGKNCGAYNGFKKLENYFKITIFFRFLSPGKIIGWYHKMMKRPNLNYYNGTYYDRDPLSLIFSQWGSVSAVEWFSQISLYGTDLLICTVSVQKLDIALQ